MTPVKSKSLICNLYDEDVSQKSRKTVQKSILSKMRYHTCSFFSCEVLKLLLTWDLGMGAKKDEYTSHKYIFVATVRRSGGSEIPFTDNRQMLPN